MKCYPLTRRSAPTSPHGRGELRCRIDQALPRQRKNPVDIEMGLDVIGERIERALDSRSIPVIGSGNTYLRKKRSAESV